MISIDDRKHELMVLGAALWFVVLAGYVLVLIASGFHGG